MPLEKLITIIVPIYNVEEYLDRCIQSIVNQTYGNIEVVLVDDGSSDGCFALCDQWAEKDERIYVIHKDNGGVSSARNVGIAAAKGEWISFVDADDWLHPQFLETLMTLAANSSSDIICANYVKTETESQPEDIACDRVTLPKT